MKLHEAPLSNKNLYFLPRTLPLKPINDTSCTTPELHIEKLPKLSFLHPTTCHHQTPCAHFSSTTSFSVQNNHACNDPTFRNDNTSPLPCRHHQHYQTCHAFYHSTTTQYQVPWAQGHGTCCHCTSSHCEEDNCYDHHATPNHEIHDCSKLTNQHVLPKAQHLQTRTAFTSLPTNVCTVSSQRQSNAMRFRHSIYLVQVQATVCETLSHTPVHQTPIANLKSCLSTSCRDPHPRSYFAIQTTTRLR